MNEAIKLDVQAKRIDAPEGIDPREVYSEMKDRWFKDSDLIRFEFPYENRLGGHASECAIYKGESCSCGSPASLMIAELRPGWTSNIVLAVQAEMPDDEAQRWMESRQ